MTLHAEPSLLDRVKRTLVALRMPRALEVFDATLRGIERGETTAHQAIDTLLAEEHAWRETRRICTALVMARLSTMKTLAGFDFTFQPSLDRDRIFALAELGFIERTEVIHFLGPPGTGKSHLAVALGIETVDHPRTREIIKPRPDPPKPAPGEFYFGTSEDSSNGIDNRRRPWRSFEAVELATPTWVAWFNSRRLLEPIGNIPPAEAEERYCAMLDEQQMAA